MQEKIILVRHRNAGVNNMDFPDKSGKKVDAVTIQQRVGVVIELLLEGHNYQQIQQLTAKEWNEVRVQDPETGEVTVNKVKNKNWWGVGERQISVYIKKAEKIFEKKNLRKITTYRNIQEARFLWLYQKSLSCGDYRAAITALNGINKLFALEAPVKIEVPKGVEVTLKMQDLLESFQGLEEGGK